MTVVSITECEKRVAACLTAGPDDGTYASASTDQTKVTAGEITDAILESDLEVCRTIVETPGNGYRAQYLANSADLNYGDSVGAHPGKIGHVDIKVGSDYLAGILAPSLEAIAKWKADTTLFPTASARGRYYITEDHKVFFIGDKARVQVITDIVKTAACQAPIIYTASVIRGAVSLLGKDGVDMGMIQNYYAQFQRDLEMIKAGAAAVPALDMYKRAVG